MKVTWDILKRVGGGGGVRTGLQSPEGSDAQPHPTCLSRLCLGHRKLMCELGNVVINQIYEARVEAMAVKKPGPSCSR